MTQCYLLNCLDMDRYYEVYCITLCKTFTISICQLISSVHLRVFTFKTESLVICRRKSIRVAIFTSIMLCKDNQMNCIFHLMHCALICSDGKKKTTIRFDVLSHENITA